MEDETKLYTYLGNEYDINDLQRNVDSGMDNYISRLRRSKKYEKQFREATANLMAGLGDGSITFENGHYHDSLGRYRNSDNRKNDVYGWAAHYIFDNMRRTRKYQRPEDTSKKKWNPNALSKAFIQDMFNSNNPNGDYFIEQDPFNTETNQRDTAIRSQMVADWLDKHATEDFYNGYSDLTHEQKQNQLRMAREASAKLRENGFDTGDLLYLSRALPDIPWNDLFTTGQKVTQNSNPESTPNVTPKSNIPSKQDFISFLDNKWARKNNDTGQLNLIGGIPKYGDWTRSQLINAIKGMDYKTLGQYLVTAIEHPYYDFGNDNVFKRANGITIPSKYVALQAVQKMMADGKLIQDESHPNIYYIPDIVNKNTNSGYYYDNNTKTIYKKSVRDIPYWQNSLYNMFMGNSGEDWIDKYFVEYQKQGGILKAQNGSPFWATGLASFDPANYKTKYLVDKLVNADMDNDDRSAWVSNVNGVGNGRYKPTNGNTKEYVQKIENAQYYKDFGKDLLDQNGNFTEVGQQWAKSVDALLPKGSKATFYDENGNLRTSWSPQGNDAYGRKAQTFTNLADYTNYIRNDQTLGSRHNVFLKGGNRYFYKDSEGNEHWVNPEDVSKYQVSQNPVRTVTSDDNTTVWNDYELTGLSMPQASNSEIAGLNTSSAPLPDKLPQPESTTNAQPTDVQPTNTGSNVTPLSGEDREGAGGQGIATAMRMLVPLATEAGRLIGTIRNNNKIAKVLSDAARPTYLSTYERYSPITGAFSEMQFRNRQAADTRRQASRAFTSDASLQLAGQLDANRQAQDLEYKGFLADDQEIRRTKQAALERQEDNMARRSDIANKNRLATAQSRMTRAQIEAARKQKNWDSTSNAIQGMSQYTQQMIQKIQEMNQSEDMALSNADYQNAINSLSAGYSDSEAMLNDPEYINAVNNLRRQQIQNYYNIMRGNRYKNNYSYKNGGQLKPSVEYLIRKVIRNENNS